MHARVGEAWRGSKPLVAYAALVQVVVDSDWVHDGLCGRWAPLTA